MGVLFMLELTNQQNVIDKFYEMSLWLGLLVIM